MSDHPLLRRRPTTAIANVGAWLSRKPAGSVHSRFTRHMLVPLWEEAAEHGVDPFGVVLMAAHETGYGRYPGQVRATSRNTCGLRVDGDALQRINSTAASGAARALLDELSHSRFATWRQGARAHVQHVLAYVPSVSVARDEIVDPRFYLVRELERSASTWRELGNAWATLSYGDSLQAGISELEGVL